MESLAKLFAPHSIAIIGASRRDGTLGKMFLDAVIAMDYRGAIYPVNPKANEINGIHCYADIDSLPVVPDLAVILIAKDYVFDALDQLYRKQVKNVVVISAGFRETGPEGAKLEEALLAKVKQYDMRMIGPNSMGIFNTHPEISLNATFSPTKPHPGHVAFISQSGALGVAVLELSRKIGLGFSIFVSTGNKADIGDVEVLQYAADDNNTSTIIMYQEALDNPTLFRQALGKIIQKKPVLTLKAGRTQSGVRAASSHTGALASDDRLTDAFLKQCGVIRCETLQELLDSAHAFSTQPLPAGNKVAVVTNAGGPGILASDALESNGLVLPSFSAETISQLKEILPAEAGLKNPVDMIASADHNTYRDVCSILYSDADVDAIFVIIVKPPVATTPLAIANELKPLIDKSDKPFFFVIMADTDYDGSSNNIKKIGVPVFAFPDSAATALGNMIKYSEILDKFHPPESANLIKAIGSVSTKRQLTFNECAALLMQYDIPVTPYLTTEMYTEAKKFLRRNDILAVKIADENVIHKSDLGLVQLNISNGEQLQNAFDQISKNAKRNQATVNTSSLLLQKMYPKGVEMIIGASMDPLLGPVIMFGTGGIFVELYQDIVFKILPVSKQDARDMISEIKTQKLLDGFRGLPNIDRSKLSEIIYSFGKLIQENTHIMEMDINPLLWPGGFDHPVVVDCRATIRD
jgi:acetate---CoA ligase (ADP-forming)